MINQETMESLKSGSGLTFSAVVAMTPSQVIGKNGGMPWHMPEDLKVFKRLTTGHPIVMGRKTFDSLGKPLPNRQNIVLTRDSSWSAEGVLRISALEDVFNLDLMDREVCIIGGAQIYALFMPMLDTLWISRIAAEYDGDTFFPDFEGEFPHAELMETFSGFQLWKYTR